MKIKPVKEVKTAFEARQIAIDWQAWQSEKSLDYGEVVKWHEFFDALGRKFYLSKEFKENGII